MLMNLHRIYIYNYEPGVKIMLLGDDLVIVDGDSGLHIFFT